MSASNFLQMKWRKGFRCIDRDRDGILSLKDLESMAEYLAKRTNAPPAEAQISSAAWRGWMLRLQAETAMDEIDEDAHNGVMERLYRDVDEVKRNIAFLSTDMFDNLDMDKDGYMYIEELGLFYSGYGVTDEQFVRKVFDTMDRNRNDVVSRSEFVDAMVGYWTNPDPDMEQFEFMYDLPIKSS